MRLEQLLLEALIEEAESSQTYKAALKNTGKDIKDGAKQLMGAANDAGAAAIQKLKDSGALEKAKEELSNPENAKKAVKGGKAAIKALLKALISTMNTEQKRKILRATIANGNVIFVGALAEVWDVIRREVEKATDISYEMPSFLGMGGGEVGTGGGIKLPDPEWLNFLGEALPYLIAFRVLIELVGFKAAYFPSKNIKEEDLNEMKDLITPEMEAAILKGLEKSVGV